MRHEATQSNKNVKKSLKISRRDYLLIEDIDHCPFTIIHYPLQITPSLRGTKQSSLINSKKGLIEIGDG